MFDLQKFNKLQEEISNMKKTPEFAKAQKVIAQNKQKENSKKRNELHKTALKLYRAIEKEGNLATMLKKFSIV